MLAVLLLVALGCCDEMDASDSGGRSRMRGANSCKNVARCCEIKEGRKGGDIKEGRTDGRKEG